MPNDTGADTLASGTANDEYGSLYSDAAEYATYGWLGAKQRSRDTVGGTILMGVRLYQPKIGRILQVDPVAGGNDNQYEYATRDPIRNLDMDGRRCWLGRNNNRSRTCRAGRVWGGAKTGLGTIVGFGGVVLGVTGIVASCTKSWLLCLASGAGTIRSLFYGISQFRKLVGHVAHNVRNVYGYGHRQSRRLRRWVGGWGCQINTRRRCR